jgi:hypothetical protein
VNAEGAMADLIVVVADVDAANAVRALIKRRESLAMREIRATVDRYVGRDSGCYLKAHDYLRPFVRQFSYAMVVFDRHGCGKERESRESLEKQVEARLASSGWRDCSTAIVLDPELETWVWSDSPEVDKTLGWAERAPGLRRWLREQGLWSADAAKPHDPKMAMVRALKAAGRRRSPAIFRQLAERVSLRRCSDPAFIKLTATLQRWFPAERYRKDVP